MVYNIKFEKVKGKKTILLVSNCVLFAVQLIMSVLFLGGTINYYGVNVSVLGIIDLSLSIINIAYGAIFEYLLKLALGITYIVATVIVIKNFIFSLLDFFQSVFNKSAKAEEICENSFASLFMNVGNTLKACLIFISLSIMTSVDYDINASGITVLILGTIVYFAVSVISFYLKNLKLESIIYKSLTMGIMVVTYILLVINLRVASFENLVFGLRATFGGFLGKVSVNVVFTAISILVLPSLYITIQFFTIFYVTNAWKMEYYLKSNYGRDSASKIMGFAIAITLVKLILTMVLANIEVVDMYQVYNIVIEEVPIVIASIVLFISYKFVDFHQVRSSSGLLKKDIGIATKTENKDEQKNEEIINANSEINITEQLQRFRELLEKGLITQEEYSEIKKKLLDL